MTNNINNTNSSPLKRLMPRFISKNTIRMCKQQLQKNNLTLSTNKIHGYKNKNKNKKETVTTTTTDITNNNNINNKKKRNATVISYFTLLPIEILHHIFTHLDNLSLYQLTLTSSAIRYQLQSYSSTLWRNFLVDPSLLLYDATIFYQCLYFLIHSQLHLHITCLTINQCPYLDHALLNIIIHAFPYLNSLSIKHATQIDCWQLLHLLRATHQKNQQHINIMTTTTTIPSSDYLLKTLKKMNHPRLKLSLLNKSSIPDTIIPNLSSSLSNFNHIHQHTPTINHPHSPHYQQKERNNFFHEKEEMSQHQILYPCLQYLTKLDIQGAFPSERSYKSYGHEMYCFGELKKILLQFGHLEEKNKHKIISTTSSSIYLQQQLSEGHYALYQFWLLLRSRMLRWDSNDNNNNSHDRNENYQEHDLDQEELEFRPPWLPETLIHFIQITEQDHPKSMVQLDLIPCRLCHRNVTTTTTSLIKCQSCQSPTSMVCHQCKCLSCDSVLCKKCYRRHQSISRQPQLQQQQNMMMNSFPSSSTSHPPTTTTRAVNSSINNNNNNNSNSSSSSGSSESGSNWNDNNHNMNNNSDNNRNNNNTKNKQQLELLSSWKTLRCHQCHLPRRTCGQPSCIHLLDKKTDHWFCASCQQKRSKSYKSPSRFFKRS
ncbi:hypothetical protein BJ944DRAFT_263827 [Cunninghamella echinulata]|nr:hypothetical protein BJ944DRAFT_263827 [Cunninghamella echinulata]